MGPGAVFEHIMKNSPSVRDTGMTPDQRSLQKDMDKPPEKPSEGFKTKQLFPGVYGKDP
jgi:hypothetical protein